MALFSKAKLKKIQAEETREKKYSVLLVDDEKDNLVTLSNTLKDEYNVLTAGDGQEALELLHNQKNPSKFQLIISDQRMPRLSGVDFLEKTLSLIPGAKRIILSGFADVEAVIAGVNHARIHEFILKPVDGHKLKLTVKRALEAWDLEQKNIRMMEELRQLNRGLEQKVAERTRDLEERNKEILRTQDQLIMQQKMASLGTLTAGIAHELKNPLNFVNNLAQLSEDLFKDLREKLDCLPEDHVDVEMKEIVQDLTFNVDAIHKHGHKADHIIASMMELSSKTSGERRPMDINELVDEFVHLAFLSKHGQDQLEIKLVKNYDPAIENLEVVPQNLSRVLVNLINNAVEALVVKKDVQKVDFEPSITVETRLGEKAVEISVHDNGHGVPEAHRDQIFHPFHTTRPPGGGHIGLGLSFCYDIVVQEHNGKIKVDSAEGEYTRFTVSLPR